MQNKKALIAGSTGLVGNELLNILLDRQEYGVIYALVRRPLNIEHPKLKEVLCDFDKLEEIQKYFNVDDVFCCLGTTIKKAKSKQKMYKVDVEYPLKIAQLASENKVKHFLIISSANANPKSILWYPKIKGVLEEKIVETFFQTISIFRPSLLLGKREEFRLAESLSARVFNWLSFLLKDSWKSHLAIDATTVAKAMVQVAQLDKSGVSIYSASAIDQIGKSLPKENG